jgi:hypothetical protein
MDQPRCGTCFCFVRDPSNLGQGSCHGVPPTGFVLHVTDPIGRPQQAQGGLFPPVAASAIGCTVHQDWPAYVAARKAQVPV